MCCRIICSVCKKYTWAGCGLHIDKVLKDLRPEQLCTCKR